jgi:stage II sporulation protein D
MRKFFKRKTLKISRRNKKMLLLLALITLTMIFSLIILPLSLILCFDKGSDYLSTPHKESQYITLYRQEAGRTISLNLEDYVAGVVAGEMPATFEMEALKAQAVAARTYGISKAVRGEEKGNSADHLSAPLCDSTHCQVYRSEDELRELKGDSWMDDGWKKIKEAVRATDGEVMYYEEGLVEQPLFHSASGGKTENSEDVFVSALPYLRSVESPYEAAAPYQSETISMGLATFAKKTAEKYGSKNIAANTIKILSRSEGGRVKDIQVGDKVLSGRDIRDLAGLRSANFTFAFDGNENIIFTTDGYGHGVGMSQWGANGMAKAGFNYKEILEHYYLGVTISP